MGTKLNYPFLMDISTRDIDMSSKVIGISPRDMDMFLKNISMSPTDLGISTM